MTYKKKKQIKEKGYDGLTAFLVGLFLLFLISGGGAAFYAYSFYHDAFPDGIQPKATKERVPHQVAPSKQLTPHTDTTDYSEAEAQARAEWGQLGDYFGGTLNPLFSFVAVLALLITLIVQSKELKLSREELSKSSAALSGQNKAIVRQSFEQTFFAWLNNYHELLQSITETNPVSRAEVTGRAALYAWWGPGVSSLIAFELAKERIRKNGGDEGEYLKWYRSLKGLKNETKAAVEFVGEELTPAVLSDWNASYLKHEYQLDSLFRNLYRLILWIDSQHESQLTQAQKWLYVGIVRGQLSWIEQVYLFYNGLTERGEKFRKLANMYALFDNLTFVNDPVLEFVRHNSPAEVAYMRSAFDSVPARRALSLPDTAEETMALAALGEQADA